MFLNYQMQTLTVNVYTLNNKVKFSRGMPKQFLVLNIVLSSQIYATYKIASE
jgi:hypothetical protein